MQEDTNAGLIGPSIIYARGQMEEVMATHREFPILYMSFDEHVSFMSKINNMTANNTSSGSNMTSGIDNSASQHDSSCSSSATYSGSCNASVYPSSNDGGSSQGTQGRTGGSQEFSDLINADASYGNRSIWEPQLTNLLSSAWGNGATTTPSLRRARMTTSSGTLMLMDLDRMSSICTAMASRRMAIRCLR
jgi:hypothetical protein